MIQIITSFIRAVGINEIWFNYATFKYSYLRYKIHFLIEMTKITQSRKGNIKMSWRGFRGDTVFTPPPTQITITVGARLHYYS